MYRIFKVKRQTDDRGFRVKSFKMTQIDLIFNDL